MAEQNYFNTIEMAMQGRDEYIEWLLGRENTPTEAENIVAFLRAIPADDMAKKRELVKYFQTPDGQRYSKAERKAFYDQLLGVQRNAMTIGVR